MYARLEHCTSKLRVYRLTIKPNHFFRDIFFITILLHVILIHESLDDDMASMHFMHYVHVLHPHMHHMHGGIYKRVEESSKRGIFIKQALYFISKLILRRKFVILLMIYLVLQI